MADFLESMGDDWNGETPTEEAPETPAAPEAEAAPAEQAPDEVEAQPEAGDDKPDEGEKFNPTLYKEMKEERRKRQEAERELERLRTQAPATPQPAAQAIPDAYEQPEQFGQHFATLLDQQTFNMRAELSGFKAEQAHGKETVEAATKWALEQNDPYLGQRVRTDSDPVGLVVKEYMQSRTLETIAGRSFEDAARDYATQQGWIVSPEAETPSAQQQSPPAPPRSLARVPGSGAKPTIAGADWGEVKFPLG